MEKFDYDVTIIGGGPAGLAAALSAANSAEKVLLIERESRLGGVLKQCIHDGFGVIRFGEKLSGCEYATRYMHMLADSKVAVMTQTFASKIEKTSEGFQLSLSNLDGYKTVTSKALILATGCRERTARQVAIHGTRPAGVLTAGTAQYYVNVLGQMPGKNCVILGSGDIGLIMARRMTLEGAKVLGVYEAKPEPSGLMRNIYQCLVDFDIPLHLSHTVVQVHGRERLEGVTVAQVDSKMNIVQSTEEYIPCDTLILSVGLIPENELAESLGVELSPETKGAICDEGYMTSLPGVFACGNALHVNDLVDYVSESGEKAGTKAAQWAAKVSANAEAAAEATDGAGTPRNPRLPEAADNPETPSGSKATDGAAPYIPVEKSSGFAYIVPHKINQNCKEPVEFLFRSKDTLGTTEVKILLDDVEIFKRKYTGLRPPEMEKIQVDFSPLSLKSHSKVKFVMEVMEDGK